MSSYPVTLINCRYILWLLKMAIESLSARLARQPILNRKGETFGYELLFRRPENGNNAPSEVDDEQSLMMFSHAVFDFGLKALVGDGRAFLNLTGPQICSDSIFGLPKDHIVLEILESVVPDEEILKSITRLKKKGFKIALDDYAFQPQLDPFLPLVDIIKVDVPLLGKRFNASNMRLLQSENRQLLAEKVEDRATYDMALGMHFDLFQGYYFTKPKVIEKSCIGPNQAAAVRFLGALSNPNASLETIIAALQSDVALSYRLLNALNSAKLGIGDQITSVKQAMLILGLNQVTSMAALMVMGSQSGKPKELLVTSLVRAHFCEKLAQETKSADPTEAFTVGLFSLLEAVFDLPMNQILLDLPLADRIKAALIGEDSENPLQIILESAKANETGFTQYSQAKYYMESLRYAERYLEPLAA